MTEAATPIHVLLVEDEPGDAGLAQLALRDSHQTRFEVDWVRTLAEARGRLGEKAYAVVLLDLGLPDSLGLDTLAKIRTIEGAPPIVVLTGLDDADFGLSTLKSGAADYLVKGDFGYDGLARTILYTLHRTRLEKELATYRLHLEELVAQRTVELAKAKEVAETANRAKTVFLANMSHELRTPLNAILGFAQMMERDARIPDDERQNLQTINRSGRHLLTIINEVLEITRIEAGRLSLQPEACDLHQLVASAGEILALRARDKGLSLNVEIAPSLPHFVITDAGKLRQILLNLLGNAVKYTERGHIRLAASAEIHAAQAAMTFLVTDTGVGIAANEHKSIFEPFYQTEAGIAVGEGTGLGLTISRSYARLLGGDLSVASLPGQGSSFCLTLTAPVSEAVEVKAMHHGHVLGLAPGQHPYRVLVAEDDADSRRLLESILLQAEFEVRIAENGQQAVTLFQAWHPDFIWMDIRMPVMNGFEAVKRIRALPGGHEVKIAALTASVFLESRKDILASGCDGVLAKPLDEEKLFALMGELLGLRYRYAEAGPEEISSASETADFSELPEPIRQRLRDAATQLDIMDVLQIADELESAYPEAAKRVRELVNGFDFDAILTQVVK